MENLGRYEILGELGRGGCGVVYRALDPGIGRTVAIKTIRADGSGDSLRERFRREARSAGSLSHPNIVTIHEFSDSGDVMFIAMEYVDGQTLGEHMGGRDLPLEFVLATLRSAADALDFAHAHNIVHRDVKPANFLLTKHGLLKITDFGIAKMLDNDVGPNTDGGLTKTGMVVGTAQYMSPEQIAAAPVTGRSDQFSLGVITYEMLTGQKPFQGNSWASMMHSIIASEPPPLSKYKESLGDPVTEVLRKALAKDPVNRYATCREFSEALEHSILGATVERRAFWSDAVKATATHDLTETMVLPATQSGRPATAQVPAGTITATDEILPPAAQLPPGARVIPPPAAPRRSWALPILGGAVVALAAWVGVLTVRHQAATPAPAASLVTAPREDGAPPQPAAIPAAPASQAAAPEAPAKQAPSPRGLPAEARASVSSQARPTSVPASAAPTPTSAAPIPAPSPSPVNSVSTVASPAPAVVAPVVVPPPVAVAAPLNVTPPAVVPPAQTTPAAKAVDPPPQAPAKAIAAPPPVPTPVPAPAPVATASPAPTPPRGPDPAEVAAQRRAAELQAARRLIADAVNLYSQAFEARDLAQLKKVWPGLGRNEQNSFQDFFRIARSIKLELMPLGDPVLTASGATARYRRSMTASDARGALPVQDQAVKISFRKSGDRMLIDSIEATDR